MGHLGERMSAEIVARSQRRVGKEVNPGRKVNSFQSKRREWRTSVTGALETNHDSSVSLRGHGSVFDRIGRRREQRCSLLEKARQLKLERNRICGEFKTMLNSCPGKGIVDTGCAQR